MRRLLFFLTVGALGFVVDAGVSTALVKAGGASPLLARIPAFVLASLATYVGNRRFTFAERQGPLVKGWFLYVGSTAFGALLNYAVFCAAIGLLRPMAWAVPLSIAAGSAAGLGVNYYCASALVFKRPNLAEAA
jgi:putative flippase GtrA